MSDEEKAPISTTDKDEAELAKMGYKQELKRELGLMQNFGVSFSIISVITGIPSLFLYGLNTGGPAVMVYGWIIVSFFTLLVGMAMAGAIISSFDQCPVFDVLLIRGLQVSVSIPLVSHPSLIPFSAHPTSGGPYFWAAMLSKPKDAPLASWITGWFNLLGQVAVTTGISFACASFISTLSTFKTGFLPTANTQIGVYAAVLFTQGLINTFGVRVLHYLNNVSVWWHAIGTFSLVVAILAKAPTHQSGHFVFQTFIDGTGGWAERASPAYVAVTGILMAQYTLTGFDASAHMTEETTNAAMSGSIGIIMAIGVSALLGMYLLLGLLFSIQDLDNTINSTTGQPVAQIFLDCVGEDGAIVLMVLFSDSDKRSSLMVYHLQIIVIGAMYFCGTFSVTSNSRMMYAFARDGGLPGSRFFAYVNTRWKSPIRTVWLACTLSFILGLPSLGSAVAFSAATTSLNNSTAIPIALRVIYHADFVRGPFHLGIFSFPIAITAVTWIAFIAIVFILPQENPVDSQTLNYAIVAVGIVITYSFGYWLISARKWFVGPVKQKAVEEMGINVTEPGLAEKN
ncbi:APC amino acid permease [Lentinula aciculospora]|uniref:APC amino acid permease n=1 Tax=Lentinula aciculospora TaxID=153920 RepID=A0A9W9AVC2_9AGAR|nr:APC amino acid permease [Lentinula aciculospora]